MEIPLNTERLTECRNKLGITKMEAARRMNLSQPAYVRYENGNRTPSIQTLNIIASVLNTSVDYLTNKTDNPSPNMYIITKEDDPSVFELLELFNKFPENDALTERILCYAKGLL